MLTADVLPAVLQHMKPFRFYLKDFTLHQLFVKCQGNQEIQVIQMGVKAHTTSAIKLLQA